MDTARPSLRAAVILCALVPIPTLICDGQIPANSNLAKADTQNAPQVPAPGFTATSEQFAICGKHDLSPQRCQQLVTELSQTRSLAVGNPSPLDNPSTDTVSFAYELEPLALVQTIRDGLNLEASNAAQTAMQAISTNAAVTQVGGNASTNGSTNLAAKPTTTDLLSLASESGAFTDTLNGTTATIQANALGLVKFLGTKPVFERWESKYADSIQPLNFTVSLNVAQSSASTATTTGSANTATPSTVVQVLIPQNNASFSSFSASYDLYRPYNPQDKNFIANWAKAVTANQSALNSDTAAIKTAVDALLPPSLVLSMPSDLKNELAAWHSAAQASESASGGKGNLEMLATAFKVYDDAFCAYILKQPKSPQNAMALLKAIQSFDGAVDAVVNQARGTPLATLSYTYSTPVQQPSTHSFTAAVSYLFKGNVQGNKGSFMSGAELTGNFTGEIYSSVPAGAKYTRLKDLQVSAEFDKPFGGTVASPRATWSLAGYGQYQYDPSVLNITAGDLAPGTNISLPSNAQELLGTAGWLGIAQAKLVINLKNGLNVPVAVKWSNKTNLLQGSDTRGQIGISYDLSALKSLVP